MENQFLFPDFKQAALDINESDKIFFSDEEIALMLREKLESDKYRFALMRLQDYLLSEYQINFIRSENEQIGKGYKKATDSECIEVTAEKLHRKFRSTACKQRKILDIVDRQKLSENTKFLYDRHIIKNGLMVSFLNKTPLSKCLPNSFVKIDIPKLIDNK